jgi:hypothetical protein
VVVGLVVLSVIVGAVLAFENSQANRTGAVSGVPEGGNTAQPLPTSPIPYPEVPRIALDEARSLLDTEEAILVDVRSESSYDRAHAAGAISVPESEVNNRLDELPRDQELILYCT